MEPIKDFENIQVDLSSIPKYQALEMQGLQPKYLRILLLGCVIFFILLLAALAILWIQDDEFKLRPYFYLFFLGVLLVFLSSLLLSYKTFQHKAFAFRQKDISYRSGWIWRSITTIPFNRVQHCEVNQGLLDRYFDLGKLKIFTAGGSSSDLTIPGISIEHANELKQYILSKVQEYGQEG